MLKEDNNPQSSLQTNRKSFDFKIDSLLSGYDSLFTLTQVLYGGKSTSICPRSTLKLLLFHPRLI